MSEFIHKGYELLIRKNSTAKVDSDHVKRLRMIHASIFAAKNPTSKFEYPPKLDFHELQGDRRGEYALAINGAWRVVFSMDGTTPCRLNIENYH